MTTLLILAVLIFAAAVLYSSVGHAGASGYLAAMAFMNVAPATMRPTALVLNLIVATLATIRFGRAGLYSHGLLWPFAIASVPMAFVGGAVQLPGHWYKTLVGLVLLVAAVRLLIELRPMDSRQVHRPPLVPAILSGAVIGLLSGLTGTGGGIFLSPLLLFTGWAETRETGGVSAAFILVNSAAGLAGNVTSVQALPSEIVWWVPAAFVGGLLGSELGARRIATRTFRQLLAAVLVVAGLKLIFAP
jgi:hypothetical protein